jgi:GxxExxY protein
MKYEQITSDVIGAAIRVHTELGSGFQELIYQRALAIEMDRENISYAREVAMPVHYGGHIIGERRVDFLVEKVVSVEIKAVARLEPVHLAQAKNYLEAFRLDVGLLINFGESRLVFKRLAR